MENKIQLPQPRLEQLKSLIKIEAQKKAATASKIIEDKKELNFALQNDAFKYSELFDALDSFNEGSHKIFDKLERVYSKYLRGNNYDPEGMFTAMATIMSLVNEINSKRVFISEKKEEYSTLLDHLDELREVECDPDKF